MGCQLEPTVFLDWFGVLASPKETLRQWRRAEARILQTRYGGSCRTWLTSHDKALRWYSRYWSRYGPESKADYHMVWVRSEIEWARRTLILGKIETRMSKKELFDLDRELVYRTSRGVNAMRPEARRVLNSLKNRKCRVYLVSGADSDFIKGILEGSEAQRYFDDVFSPDKLNAFKGGTKYWRRILQVSGERPQNSIVVDDQAKNLVTPLRLGMKPILLSRNPANKRFTTIPSVAKLSGIIQNLE